MDTKKLRQKILDLAIHGKLVPQDPNDEPASVLLERIKAEKEQLIKEGKIKRQKKSASSDTSHYGNIPDEWCEAPMSELFILNPKSKLADESLCGFIPMSLVEDGFSGRHYFETRNWGQVKKGFSQFQNGDIGIAKISPCFENLKSVIFENLPNGNGAGTTELTILRSLGVYSKFYLYLFKSGWYISEGTKYFKGVVGQQRVNKEIFTDLIVPLPPLNEQKRIVEEIDRYFALVDVLEQNEYDLKDAVQKAKSKILDLALSGRLTSDTSHYRKWPYLPLSEIFNITMGQSPEGYYINQNNDGVEFHQGKLHFGQRHLLNSGVFTSNITKVADACSLLMCVRAPVGVLNITNREVCIGRGLCALKPKDSNMPIEYWYYALSSLSNYFEENSTGSTFKAITMNVIKTTYVYVPPVNEQRLIVRQLEHIYKIIDSILNHLTP